MKAAPPETLSLNGPAWKVRSAADASDEIPATVPGCIHTDLRAAGKIEDPFYRDNENKLQWIGERAWTYSRSFDVPAAYLEHPFVHLRFEGLDTLATVRLNGKELLRTDNMFRTYEVDARPLLRPGGNTIEITFAPTADAIHPADKKAAFPGLGGNFIRKEPCNYGWDWGPKFVTCGVWKPISLVAYDHARWRDVAIAQDHREKGKVRLDIDLAAETDGQLPLTARTVVTFGGQPVANASQPLQAGNGRATLYVPNPQLWWPNEMGPQNLYEVAVELLDADGQTLDRLTRRIGLRTVEWLPKTDQHPTGFKVNGKPFFAKGYNWIPCETFAPLVTTEKLRRYVDDAVAVHMNMLRFWGGGYYEEDALFDACDEAGILIWLDLKFACNHYPSYDRDFMENVRAEAQDNVRRLRHHPSIAIWSGNNECIFGVGDRWEDGRSSRADYDRLFSVLLRGQVQELSPGANYTPGSPESGDEHNWNVWHGNAPFESFDGTHGFMSEFGFQSFPEPRTVRSFTTPEDRASVVTSVMKLHQKNGDGRGNEKIAATIEKYFRRPKDFDSTLWLSQILQAMGIKRGVEHWRADWPRSTGSLIWQYNDCWPVASWSSVDYFGRWKALHYASRHFYAPLLVAGVANAQTGKAEINVMSDSPEPKRGLVAWMLTDLTGAKLARGDGPVDIPAGPTSVKAANLDLRKTLAQAGRENVLLWLQLSVDGKTVSENLLTFVRPKALRLQNPEIEFKLDGSTATLTAKRPALYAWIELENADARFSDNFIHLRAGEPVSVQITFPAQSEVRTKSKFIVRSLYDTYDPNAPVTGEDHTVAQAPDGAFLATAAKAEILGDNAVLEDNPTPNIGRWDNLGDALEWTLQVKTPGTFQVIVDQGIHPISPGGEYVVSVGDASIPAKVVTTKDWHDYTAVQIGELRIDQPGDVKLTVKPTAKPKGFVMNLRSVRLVPKGAATPSPVAPPPDANRPQQP